MAPGSCVHASYWAIDSSVDPENFDLEELQKDFNVYTKKYLFNECFKKIDIINTLKVIVETSDTKIP